MKRTFILTAAALMVSAGVIAGSSDQIQTRSKLQTKTGIRTSTQDQLRIQDKAQSQTKLQIRDQTSAGCRTCSRPQALKGTGSCSLSGNCGAGNIFMQRRSRIGVSGGSISKRR